jgi:hypothetical protein
MSLNVSRRYPSRSTKPEIFPASVLITHGLSLSSSCVSLDPHMRQSISNRLLQGGGNTQAMRNEVSTSRLCRAKQLLEASGHSACVVATSWRPFSQVSISLRTLWDQIYQGKYCRYTPLSASGSFFLRTRCSGKNHSSSFTCGQGRDQLLCLHYFQ